jgi:hypothetical protein
MGGTAESHETIRYGNWFTYWKYNEKLAGNGNEVTK